MNVLYVFSPQLTEIWSFSCAICRSISAELSTILLATYNLRIFHNIRFCCSFLSEAARLSSVVLCLIPVSHGKLKMFCSCKTTFGSYGLLCGRVLGLVWMELWLQSLLAPGRSSSQHPSMFLYSWPSFLGERGAPWEFTTFLLGVRYSSVVENLPSVYKLLGLLPATT